MEFLVLIVLIVAIGFIAFYGKSKNKIDINKDGKIDSEEIKVAVENTKTEIKTVAKKTAGKVKAAVQKNTRAKK